MSTNSTYNATVPAMCQPYINALTNPPYSMSCATSLYSDFPDNNSTFKSCCSGNAVADYASPGTSESCWQYCNATSREQEASIYSCMKRESRTSGIWCEGALNSDGSFSSTSSGTRLGGGGWKGGFLLLSLAFTVIMGI